MLQQIRELLMQADQTMKAVTVGYFQQQHTLTAPCPVQFQTMCESSRLYEPGSQYMKFVRRLPDSPSQRASESNPFCFEPYTPGMENILQLEKHGRKVNLNDQLFGWIFIVSCSGARALTMIIKGGWADWRWVLGPRSRLRPGCPTWSPGRTRARPRASRAGSQSRAGRQVPATRLRCPTRTSQ